MKKIILLLFSAISFIGYSQIPAYYNDVNLNLSGQALKTELASKISNTHTTFLIYTPGVWDALKQTDLDPTDPTKVLLVYGWDDLDSDITNDRSRGKDTNGGNVGEWNREHVYPRSLGTPNLGSEGPGSDAHSLRPSDGQRNSSRNNRKFGAGTGSGSAANSVGDWYPGDEWKGDVARMMMYMYLRYGNRCLPINVGTGNPVTGDTDMIDLFLQWNADDPVSAIETQRNPILENLQGNRNPFIDNPAFATEVWGGPQAEDIFNNGGGTDTESPTAPTSLVASNIAAFSANLSWADATDNIGVTAYNVYKDGVFIASNISTSYSVTGLSANTTYSFYIEARDAAGNVSPASNTISITTQDIQPGGSASDLFFSEYIEGSSFNKALEIANFTGASVDLSTYTIKKQTNGAGSWSGGLLLSGILTSGDVFVVANSSSNAIILNVTNIPTGSSEVTFNGNDAVGLFKNDVLIDIIGTFDGGSGNFAQNTTLIRKPTVTSPSITYTVAEWDSFASDTFTDLGIHTFDLGDTEVPSAPASLVASNITDTTADLTWTAATDNVGVTGYEIFQDGISLGSTTAVNYNVIGLTEETTYAFTVTANDDAGNVSVTSNIENVTTTAAPDTEVPTAPTTLTASNITDITADLTWTAATDNVGVTGYDIFQDGSFLASTTTTNYNVSGLIAETTYAFVVIAKDAAGNFSTASNVENVSTTATPSGGYATDLFFSEYIEGSSFNKALEIANFTNVSIDISIYTIKKQTNGAGAWTAGLALSGTLVDGDVYVVAHSSASTAVQTEADLLVSSSQITFNGNDAVGLFKNDVLIDIIGTFDGGTANFAKDVTIVRKATIAYPSVTYETTEWDSFSSNTFTFLGSHIFNSGSGTDTEVPTAPTNLVASNITEASADLSWTASTDNVGVTGYDVYQDGTLLGNTMSTTYSITGLSELTSYDFTVTAIDAVGNVSVASNTESITTPAAPDTESPTEPVGLVASNITEVSADLSWTASTDNVGVIGYDVYQDGILLANTTTTSYNVIGLASQTMYVFEVIAKDIANNESLPATVTISTGSSGSTTILHEGFFESGFNGWIDGGSDCNRYNGPRSFEGNYSIKLRDNSGAASSMTLENIDVSTYDTVDIEFYFYSFSMENNEDFWVRYHDGSSWTTVATYARGVDFQNNNFYVSTITLDTATYNFANNAKFRFQNDASGNGDHIYIDQVTIKGITNSSSALLASTSKKTSATVKYIKSLNDIDMESEEDFIISSNPVVGNKLQIQFFGEMIPKFRVLNVLGQVIKKGYLNNNSIDVGSLKAGIYIIELDDDEEIMSKKFIKK